MRRFARLLLPLLCVLLLLPSCASTKVAKGKEWKAGDTVICPHCGREFPIPEKLGK